MYESLPAVPTDHGQTYGEGMQEGYSVDACEDVHATSDRNKRQAACCAHGQLLTL